MPGMSMYIVWMDPEVEARKNMKTFHYNVVDPGAGRGDARLCGALEATSRVATLAGITGADKPFRSGGAARVFVCTEPAAGTEGRRLPRPLSSKGGGAPDALFMPLSGGGFERIIIRAVALT